MLTGMPGRTDTTTQAAAAAPTGHAASAMLSVREARERLLAAVESLSGVETVALADALGRVAATPLVSERNVPSSDNSAMDGVALRHADLVAAGGRLSVVGRTAAGQPPGALTPGTAMGILTGAVVPAGADTVVPIEATERSGDAIRVLDENVAIGANIRRAGEDVARGAVVVPAGRALRPQDIGVAAAIGAASLAVRPRLRVALVVTGDELVEPGQPLAPGQLYDSNGPMLSAVLSALGCHVIARHRVGDDLATTTATFEAASQGADLVLSSGGVSVGEEDHVKAAVRTLGAIEVWKVAVQPGKPIGFGRVGSVPWLGLPGNPVSSLVTLLVFGVPLVRRLQGREPLVPSAVPVPAGFSRERVNKREEYVRVALRDGALVPYHHQGSGVLSSTVHGDGLACIPAGSSVREGDTLAYTSFAEYLG